MRAASAVALLAACSAPAEKPFAMPKNIEDARGRLLARIPEGREIDGARQWMGEHGFACAAPVEWRFADHFPGTSEQVPFDGRAHLCRPDATTPADAGFRAWKVILLERKGRLADVSVTRD